MVVIVSKSKHSFKKSYSVRRKEGNKRYRPIILIGTEGTDTEPEYFNLVKSIFNSVTIKICPSRGTKGSSPDRVLKRMRSELALTPLKKIVATKLGLLSIVTCGPMSNLIKYLIGRRKSLTIMLRSAIQNLNIGYYFTLTMPLVSERQEK